MMMHKITPSVDYNWWMSHVNKPTNQNSIKVPNIIKPTNKKVLL